MVVVYFFFQKKKQKALFRFAEGLAAQPSAKPTLGVWGRAPRNLTLMKIFFFFQKKKQKALFRFAEGLATQPSAKPTLGVWGRAPRNLTLMKNLATQASAKPTLEGLGPCPQEPNPYEDIFFFQKKKQKALSRFAEGWRPKPRRSRPRGFGGLPPRKRQCISIID
jgi:hypothetical protein